MNSSNEKKLPGLRNGRLRREGLRNGRLRQEGLRNGSLGRRLRNGRLRQEGLRNERLRQEGMLPEVFYIKMFIIIPFFCRNAV
ncbi:uncharacterized protein OCT59_009820 [Rhizophagus irregularis]|uniref:uncharacterized protein n=1 Tax=Rhizophagus irregularis TaxID=588596 RepID=UPI0033308515|nr:hypothetical protein OCT59_009820 [Rhizophagus irregularis]